MVSQSRVAQGISECADEGCGLERELKDWVNANLDANAYQAGAAIEYSLQTCSAIATALNKADALLTVSWYSEVGTESATTPAPAWM